MQLPVPAIEYRNAIHSVELRQEPIDSPALVPMRQNLRVTRRSKHHTVLFQFVAEGNVVIDLSVLEGHDLTIMAQKRLPPPSTSMTASRLIPITI